MNEKLLTDTAMGTIAILFLVGLVTVPWLGYAPLIVMATATFVALVTCHALSSR